MQVLLYYGTATLSLQNDVIFSFSFAIFVSVLDLSHNSLAELPDEFSQLEKLESIDVSHNKMQQFPEVLQRLPALSTIDLSSNEISDIHAQDFTSSQSLEELNVSSNPLSDDVIQLLQSIIRVKVII